MARVAACSELYLFLAAYVVRQALCYGGSHRVRDFGRSDPGPLHEILEVEACDADPAGTCETPSSQQSHAFQRAAIVVYRIIASIVTRRCPSRRPFPS
jgi:hypothetical protein